MAFYTIANWIALILSGFGAYAVVGFVRYKGYFNKVDAVIAGTNLGSIYKLPKDQFIRFDNVVRRAYFTKLPPEKAIEAVLHEVSRA